MSKNESKLEKEYKALVEKHQKQIDEHLNAAQKELNKAVKLSEETGIAFSSSISPLSQGYTPANFRETIEKHFASVENEEEREELIEKYAEDFDEGRTDYDSGDGWQHSAVCY